MTSIGFLKKLTDEDLKVIARKEGLKNVPRNYERDDLIKYLEGVLTVERIKRYREQYFERDVERDIHIHEKIKERGYKASSIERTKVKFDRNEVIVELSKSKITKQVVESITTYLHEPMPSGTGVNFYDKMSEKTLKLLNSIFLERSADYSGVNFEFLCTNWLVRNYKEISRVENRHKFPKIGEIDIVGYDQRDLPVVIGECKDRSVSYSDIDKWIRNSKSLAEEYGDQLMEVDNDELTIIHSYFFGSRGYSQGVTDRVKNDNNIDDGAYVIPTGLLGRKRAALFKIFMYDVRDGKFYQEY